MDRIKGIALKAVFIAIISVWAMTGLQAQNITVASYNIRNQNGKDAANGNGWEQRYPWICSLIGFECIDIFGAQEVLSGQKEDMLRMLPEYDCIYAGRDDGRDQGEGSPIFYRRERFQVLDSGWFWMSETPDVPSKGWDAALPRICTWGKFRDRQTGKRLWFFNLHMDHRGIEARRHAAELVTRRIHEWCRKNETVFLTGDFNVDQDNEIYSIFTASGKLSDSYETAQKRHAPNGTANTFDPDLFTKSRIDHIFIAGKLSVISYGILTETYRSLPDENTEDFTSENFPEEVMLRKYKARIPSDHFPVIIRAEL